MFGVAAILNTNGNSAGHIGAADFHRAMVVTVLGENSCQLPRNSAETTSTTSPEQIEVMKLER